MGTMESGALEGLEPKPVWAHFAELAKRPRPSGEEAEVRAYVLEWADTNGFSHVRDDVGNVVISVPGRGIGQKSPLVLMQGHLDMVCEKNAGVDHDFFKDPIRLVKREGRIYADRTTLGADNGIGVALALAAGDGLFPHHPPLEILLTVDEETGMSGARELDASMITARRMINLDAEEEGVLYVGCAGGLDTLVSIELERQESYAKDAAVLEISVSGLKGGHSGLDIGCNRGNAIRLLAQGLLTLDDCIELVEFDGGSKRNAIPREAKCIVRLKPDAEIEELESRLLELKEIFSDLHGDSEDNIELVWSRAESSTPAFTPHMVSRLLDFLFTVPAGVITLSQTIAGLVETSNNLGVVSHDGQEFTVVLCTRSSNGAALRQVAGQITKLAERCGLNWRHRGGYPGWQPDASSKILQISKDVFRKLADGKEPKVTAVHAGLECGLLGAVVPGMDMIAFGPDIQDAHSPDESVSISSVGVVARQVEALLEALCTR